MIGWGRGRSGKGRCDWILLEDATCVEFGVLSSCLPGLLVDAFCLACRVSISYDKVRDIFHSGPTSP